MKISVIIPACNEEKYIKKTLECINVDRLEVIVVCNGCTDRTFSVAKAYAKKSRKNIKVYNLKKRGVSHARNYGASKAKGEMLVFMDADIRPWHYLFEKLEKTRFTVGTCKALPDIDKPLPKILMKLKNKTHYFGTCTGLIFCKRELFERIGGFDEKLTIGEDGKFMRHAMKAGKFGVINAYVYNNMRRFEKKGYFRMLFFWIKHYFNPKHKNYEIVR